MAEQTAQSRQNHTRWVPLYHFVMGPIFLVSIYCGSLSQKEDTDG